MCHRKKRKKNEDKKEEKLDIEDVETASDDKIHDKTVDDGTCEKEGESDGETNIRKKGKCISRENIEEKEKEEKRDDTAELVYLER